MSRLHYYLFKYSNLLYYSGFVATVLTGWLILYKMNNKNNLQYSIYSCDKTIINTKINESNKSKNEEV